MNINLINDFIEGQNWSMSTFLPYDQLKSALPKHEHIFDDWLKKGFHGKMDYLERMRKDRYSPRNKLPNIQSIIVLAAWYQEDSFNHKDFSSDQGMVARYARGRDYHKVLKKKLIQLSRFLSLNFKDAETYLSVDSGPTVDRVLAEVSGLGFFGKNTCIISPSKGSYFFIASVFTNLSLPASTVKNMPNCGNCTQCIDHCPTGALVAPGQLDARKCISYLTIENRGEIPVDLRSKIGNRLFGCDICQEVCPFNLGRAHRQVIAMPELSKKSDLIALSLPEILSIKTDEEFLRRFAGTPIMRAKRRGLIRNACVVAGNSGDVKMILYLKKVLEINDSMLSEHAHWAIDQLTSKNLDI